MEQWLRVFRVHVYRLQKSLEDDTVSTSQSLDTCFLAPSQAFRIASSGRPGPCHIDLPKESVAHGARKEEVIAHIMLHSCWQDIVSMKAQVPEAIFKKAATLTADAPPMLDMGAVQKARIFGRSCIQTWDGSESFTATNHIAVRVYIALQ